MQLQCSLVFLLLPGKSLLFHIELYLVLIMKSISVLFCDGTPGVSSGAQVPQDLLVI